MKSHLNKVLQRLAAAPVAAPCAGPAAICRPAAPSSSPVMVLQKLNWPLQDWRALRAILILKFVRRGAAAGHRPAVQQAVPRCLADDGTVVVLSGDVPADPGRHLARLVAAGGGRLALLTVTPARPTGYGRIVRNADGQVAASSNTGTRPMRSAPSPRSTAASWPCPRGCCALAGAADQQQRPGRVLPDRRGRHGPWPTACPWWPTASPMRCRWRA